MPEKSARIAEPAVQQTKTPQLLETVSSPALSADEISKPGLVSSTISGLTEKSNESYLEKMVIFEAEGRTSSSGLS